jgi:acetyl esterase/lipase
MKAPIRLALLFLASALALVSFTGCSATGTLNALTPNDTHTHRDGLAYGDGPRQKYDLYTPVGAAPEGGWPVVVFFYGGSWNSGERSQYEFVGEALASRGILTLIPDYRLYPEVRYPEFLKDSAAAVAHALEKAASLGGNPKRVFAMGHSAGGYNAAMVALDPRWLKATGHSNRELAGWVGVAGAYDFFPTGNPEVQPVFFHPNYPPNSLPIDFALPGSPPAFLGAARKDDLVYPDRNTLALAAKLRAVDVPVQVQLYDRVNHLTVIGVFAQPLRWLAPVLDDAAGFVNNQAPK